MAAAAANVVGKFRGGLADLRPVPRTLIDQGPNRSLYRLVSDEEPDGPPVLLVPPLAAPALCFDLRRGCSLAEHLVAGGRRTYLVDYGNVAFSDRRLGIEHWIDEVLPRAIRKVSEDSGGQPVHLVAWCLGGLFSLLTAASGDELPIGSIATVASPVDFTAIPLIAPFRPLVEATGGHLLTPFYRVLGGAPSYVVGRVFWATGINKEITKPLAILRNLDDRDYLAQIEAVDHFMDNMIAYPGRTFGQIYHRFFRANDLAEGSVDLNGRIISLARIKVPVLVIAGENDTIAPRRAVERLTGLLDGAPSVRFETAPGGHLGVLTGRRARGTTWHHIDNFLDEVA
ncbi:alpha/beta hydrolase [Amycolatopsis acidicola]|uniref:Alpha/beta hydrolase n=1 Tax=Amycolatopsis acidicola TaxID=2596893 RepID=A0A5N0UVL4_9PSEU|nr:alpha/beta fold hydrolase [Amycolatopsis acidicola]KAA9155941.1 alpha/beta hydrolase [Amycolatopsis acidicola]